MIYSSLVSHINYSVVFVHTSMAITEVVKVEFKERRSREISGTLQVCYHSRYQKGHRDLEGVLHKDVDIRTCSRPLFSIRAPAELLLLPAYHQHHAYLSHEVATTLATHLNLDPQMNHFVTLQIASHATNFMVKTHPFGYSIKADLELLRFVESVTDNDDDEDVDYGACPVCLEDFSSTVGSRMVMTDCSHYFHKSCLLPWLKKQISCPTCRRCVVDIKNWFSPLYNILTNINIYI